jgi:hypothetical protein
LATQFKARFLASVPRPIAGLKFPTQGTKNHRGNQLINHANVF